MNLEVAVLINFFNRPDHLRNLFKVLQEVKPAILFLYQDGARNEKDLAPINACREVVEEFVNWECKVYTKYQTQNYGVDPSGYIAQQWAFSIVDKCIVLEDDDIPSASWFSFCKILLDRYENDERIGMITAFNPTEITPKVSSDYFFSSNFSIWGWASWRRVVEKWQGDYAFMDNAEAMGNLRAVAKEKQLHNGLLGKLPIHRKTGKPHYESIFYASLLLQSQLAIVPTKNMLINNGLNAEAEHFGSSLKLLPKGYRKIFTLNKYEINTSAMKHPDYVIDHIAYRKEVYKIMAWNNPRIKIGRAFETFWLLLKYREWKVLKQLILNRLKKWKQMCCK